MNDCFVKNLKGVVNDDTLSRIGEIRIELSGDTSQNLRLAVAASRSYYIRTIGDCTIYNASGTTSRGKYYSFDGSLEYMLKGSGLAFIFEGYESTQLTLTTNQSFNIEQVMARPLLKTLKAQNSVIQGDLDAAFKGTTILEKLYINGAVFDEFSITSVCGNTNINEFLVGGNATGKLEDFVEGLISNGKSSGNISMAIYNTGVTINNAPFTHSERITITFNSATDVVVKRTTGSATIATYNNGVWSY